MRKTPLTMRIHRRSNYVIVIGVFLVIGVCFMWLPRDLNELTHAFPRPPHVFIESSEFHDNKTAVPLVYFITPTHTRLEQKADLTRLSHTLRLVPRLHWIVIEDSHAPSERLKKILAKCKLPYTLFAVKTSRTKVALLKLSGLLQKYFTMPKGVEQRNKALDWLEQNAEFPSVFYFGDDDNTYDLQLFEEMRYTKKVSVWPVGLIGNAKFQTPVLRKGKVVGWAAGWIGNRKFAVDMAAFAVNTEVLHQSAPPRFKMSVGKGYTETNFLEQICETIDELEPRAEHCTKVLVWHTQTKAQDLSLNGTLRETLTKSKLTELEV